MIAPASPMRMLGTYLGPQWAKTTLLALLLLGSTGLQLLLPQILRTFIDTVQAQGALQDLLQIALLFLSVALVNQLVGVFESYTSQDLGWTATNRLRNDLALHLMHLDMRFHKAHTPGEMIERIDGDITALSNFFSTFVLHIAGNSLLLLGILVMLWREDWRVGITLAVFTAIALYLLNRVRTIAVPAVKQGREATAQLFGFLEERLAGIEDIRPNGAGAYIMRGFEQAIRTMFFTGRRAEATGFVPVIITLALLSLATILALAMSAYLFVNGAITIGTAVLFFQYTQMLHQPLQQITDEIAGFQKAGAGIARVQQLLQTRSTIVEPVESDAHLPAGALGVAFQRVSFGYEGEGSVLHDLSSTLQPGTVLGLLGRSGSGKTTLTRLLLRLYDPTSGTITLDGIDLRRIPRDELRRSVAMVTQDVHLFHASLRDNLTLFAADIPDERIIQALYELELDGWYRSLPDGLNTPVIPESLSSGEAQLLAFTRVLLRNPGLVILDEASSRLDPVTERRIERATRRLLHNRTGIIIAHRLATVQSVDEIMILDHGTIAEYGSREQLAADPATRFHRLLQIGLKEVLA